jgi:hypothetical protein
LDFASFSQVFVLAVLLPAWLVLGLMDWQTHREANIATTSGPWESAMHLLLAAEAGAAVLPAMFLEINAGVMIWMILCYAAHEITTTIDIRFAYPRRMLGPREQRIHDYLTAIPLACLLIVLFTHAGQLLAVFGFGTETAQFMPRWKEQPLPTWYLATWLVACVLMNTVPYAEELWRGIAAQRRVVSSPLPWAEGPQGVRRSTGGYKR